MYIRKNTLSNSDNNALQSLQKDYTACTLIRYKGQINTINIEAIIINHWFQTIHCVQNYGFLIVWVSTNSVRATNEINKKNVGRFVDRTKRLLIRRDVVEKERKPQRFSLNGKMMVCNKKESRQLGAGYWCACRVTTLTIKKECFAHPSAKCVIQKWKRIEKPVKLRGEVDGWMRYSALKHWVVL